MKRWLVWGSVSALALSACADQAECDPDQELRGGSCVPVSPNAGHEGDAASDAAGSGPDAGASSDAGAGGDAGNTGDAGADSGPTCDDTVQMGDPCLDAVDHGDCGCDAPYCAIQPGQMQGICTRTGCTEDPTVCPGGWQCFDLSMFDPTLPSICIGG